MEKHRIDGIKHDFDRMTDQELHTLHGYLLETHARVTDEIGLVESTIFARHHPQLDLGGTAINGAAMDPYDEVIGSYCEIADVPTWEHYTEATKDV